jgi:hypothetical protein
MTFLNCVTYANATLYKYGTRIAFYMGRLGRHPTEPAEPAKFEAEQPTKSAD